MANKPIFCVKQYWLVTELLESARYYYVLFIGGDGGGVIQLRKVVLLTFSRHKLPELSSVEIILQN